MAFFNSWLGKDVTFYIVLAVANLIAVSADNAARKDDDDRVSWTAKEYRRNIVIALLIPFFGLSAIQIICVPYDQAPGEMPIFVDWAARGIFSACSFAVLILAASNFNELMIKLNYRLGLVLLRIAIVLTFMISITIYPWISRTSPLRQIEMIAFAISFASLPIAGAILRKTSLNR